jgi:hypothetical protein
MLRGMPPTLDAIIGKAIARRYFRELAKRGGRSDMALMQEPILATIVALGIHEYRSAQARAMRAIPSEKRSAASRQNGRKGGRPRLS